MVVSCSEICEDIIFVVVLFNLLRPSNENIFFFNLNLFNFFFFLIFLQVFRLWNDMGLQPARCDPSLVGRCWLAVTAGATVLQSAGAPWRFGLLPARPAQRQAWYI